MAYHDDETYIRHPFQGDSDRYCTVCKLPDRADVHKDVNGAMLADVPSNQRDEKGRMPVQSMTEREMLAETLTILRQITDGMEQFMVSAKSNPMLRMMFP